MTQHKQKLVLQWQRKVASASSLGTPLPGLPGRLGPPRLTRALLSTAVPACTLAAQQSQQCPLIAI